MFLIASLGFRQDVNFGVDERQYAKARLVMAFLSLISFIISILYCNMFKLAISYHLFVKCYRNTICKMLYNICMGTLRLE